MKTCPSCKETFENRFNFCPQDRTELKPYISRVEIPIEPLVVENSSTVFRLTILEDKSLKARLMEELREFKAEAQLTWPEFKRDPFGFSKRAISGGAVLLKKNFSDRYRLSGVIASFVLIVGLILGVFWLDRRNAAQAALASQKQEELELIGMTSNIPDTTPKDPGNAGMAKGSGGGSKADKIKPGGGGGGGRERQTPASHGKLPQVSLNIPQVVAPDPDPPKIKNPSLPTPATLDADPVLFPPDTRNLQYGDPKSKSTDPSAGPGTGNGIGNGTGGGVGPGSGGGYGPGEGGNTGGGPRREGGGGPGGGGDGADRIFKSSELDQRARVISKPEPQYTEAARKNQITGTVVLRAIFSSDGRVTNISTVRGLPDGLTEKAITAAKQIKFSPAQKGGRPVSSWMQLEYNFNLY